jgi:hypothetical protein
MGSPVQRLRERLAVEYARLSRLEEELAGLRRVLERAELEVHAQQIRIGHTDKNRPYRARNSSLGCRSVRGGSLAQLGRITT